MIGAARAGATTANADSQLKRSAKQRDRPTCKHKARRQVEEDGALPTILERKAEMRGDFNAKQKGAYDKSRY
jgi:hypothetical protein